MVLISTLLVVSQVLEVEGDMALVWLVISLAQLPADQEQVHFFCLTLFVSVIVCLPACLPVCLP
jgi:hypothetical protein